MLEFGGRSIESSLSNLLAACENCRGNDVLFPLKCSGNVIAAHKKFLASAVKLSFDKASETTASLLPDLNSIGLFPQVFV